MDIKTATDEELRNVLNGLGEFFQRDGHFDLILRSARTRMETAGTEELRQQVLELVGGLPEVNLEEVAEVGA